MTCNSHLFIFFLVILITANCAKFANSKAGCTTSCGSLKNIYFPFRVQGDPKHCGDPRYELVCEGGEATVCVGGRNYFVTNIGIYEFNDVTVHVDCPFTTNTCRPNHTNCIDNFVYDLRKIFSNSWVSFISCSQKFEKEENMLPFSLLDDVNTYAYVVFGSELHQLYDSCKFVDTFLFGNVFFYDKMNSSMQVTEALQKGFNISWYYYDAFSRDYKTCWSNSLRYTNDIVKYDYPSRFQALASYPFNLVFFFFSCLSYKACNMNAVDDGNKCHIAFEIIFSVPLDTFVGLVGLALVCKFVLASLTVCVYLMYNCRKNTESEDSVEVFLQKQQVLQPRRYDYGEIIIMTKHFREKIGKGGFGQVYKGELFSGCPIAVKVLDGLKFNGEEFINEVSTIGTIHHINIVQLIGFCSDGTKRALIYEYMPNGSLDKYIFSSKRTKDSLSLSIEKLNDIALGIAKGINYLHTGCDMQILHFDIKPHNVLLDENFIPKISDFGLAKLYPKDQSLVSISVARGTIGYIAPELISRSFGVISQKSDVYSFGMLILEIAGRRRNVDTGVENSKEIYYPSWIFDQLTQLKTSSVNEMMVIGEVEKRLCKLGLWCIQINPLHRPTMSEVIKILESTEDEIKMPPKPFSFSTDTTIEEHTTYDSLMTLSIIVEEN